MEKKEAAKLLYWQGVTQVDISALLGVQPKTIHLWVKNNDWDKKRIEQALAKETAEERVYKLINYQLRVCELITIINEEKLEQDLNVEELKKLLIARGEIDALQKLFTTIKGKELEWTQIVKVVRDFLEYIESIDITLAKQVSQFANDFLNEKRKDL